MTEDRRYAEADVRKIFERAGSTDASRNRTDRASAGLTLAELQDIAKEVGIPPARIAEAAATLAEVSASERRNLLGMPVSVSQTVQLTRLPTDHEWELILAELRSTFGVLGAERSMGSTREWAHGSLFAVIEPTETGGRMRVGSTRPLALLVNGLGFAWILAAVITLVTLIGTGDLAGANALLPPIIGAVGAGTLLYNGSRLNRWARKCVAQLDHIVTRSQATLNADSSAQYATQDAPARE